METYRVDITKSDFFEVSSYKANDTVRIVNLRSVRGHIGEDFNLLDDAHLKKLVMDYLRTTDNVELINVLSREFNGWNWFECYDSDYNINYEPTKEELLNPSGKPNGEHPSYDGPSQIVKLERFKAEVRSKTHILPQALKGYIREGIPVEKKLDVTKINFIPVWYINGSASTRADLCELYTTLEVLVHILAKRFISFKVRLLTLVSTDIQLAVANGDKLDNYERFRKSQLVDACKKKDDKIDAILADLKRKDEQLAELKETADNLMSIVLMQGDENRKAHSEVSELLLINKGQSKDNELIKSKMNVLCNKVSQLNASNFDEDGSTVFWWYLYRSVKQIEPNYSKEIPNNCIWIYSQVREDKYLELPEDAEIYFSANVVSRSIYNSLMTDLKPMVYDTYYRHILISYDKVIDMFDKLNDLLSAKGIQPETYTVDALTRDIETMKVNSEIERIRNETTAHEIAVRQRIIDSGKFYIYIFARYRRLYNRVDGKLTKTLDANKSFYVRKGTGGCTEVELGSLALENSKFSKDGDSRIYYE